MFSGSRFPGSEMEIKGREKHHASYFFIYAALRPSLSEFLDVYAFVIGKLYISHAVHFTSLCRSRFSIFFRSHAREFE